MEMDRSEETTTRPFLGTGWAFPPQFDDRIGEVVMVSGERDIEESLDILLSTGIGERVMQPEYGCNLLEYQFEPINATLITFLRDLVEKAILYFEPRIRVEHIDVTSADSEPGEGIVRIEVRYVVASTNSRFNYVYDFYLREANVSVSG